MHNTPHEAGTFAANIMQFAHLLRRAGLPVGPAETLAAQQALLHVDIRNRAQCRTALHTTMIHRREHADVFALAFNLFWRAPEAAQHTNIVALMDGLRDERSKPPPAARRVAEALSERTYTPREEPPDPIADMTMTVSASERLQQMDFEAMSAADISAAKREIRRLRLPLDQHKTRRFKAAATGTMLDMRATLRASLRSGGEILTLARQRPRTRPPPLVVLCDISGSMGRYAQILLHFLHAVTNDRDRVHTFLFGTRLSNITRQLRQRDPEAAFELVSQIVPDWSGGTRIGEAINTFNRHWARRVLGQGAVVLLITDGLDREGARGLSEAMERLHKSCRRLIWLNPLLRWDGFEAKSQGIRAMLPHVDEFRPVHNLASLHALIALLSSSAPVRRAA